MGGLHARGREELVDAWLAVEPVAPPGMRPRRLRAPLVGRAAERQLLLDGLKLAVTHHRAFHAQIEGEGGVGKSRLAEELIAEAKAAFGATVLVSRCLPYGESDVWGPIARTIRTHAGIAPLALPDEVRERATRSVVSALGVGPETPEVQRVTEGVLQLLGSRHQPRRHRPGQRPQRGGPLGAGLPRRARPPGSADRHRRRPPLGRSAGARPARPHRHRARQPAVRPRHHGAAHRAGAAAHAGRRAPERGPAAPRPARPAGGRRAGPHAARRRRRRRRGGGAARPQRRQPAVPRGAGLAGAGVGGGRGAARHAAGPGGGPARRAVDRRAQHARERRRPRLLGHLAGPRRVRPGPQPDHDARHAGHAGQPRARSTSTATSGRSGPSRSARSRTRR